MSLGATPQLSVAAALVFAAAPAATIGALGWRLDRITRKLLAFGRVVAPLVPSGLLKPDERMIAANGLTILAASPYIVFTSIAQFLLPQNTVLWFSFGTCMGMLIGWPFGYSLAGKVPEQGQPDEGRRI